MKKAFSIVEVIFMIVLLGWTVPLLPMITNLSNESIKDLLKSSDIESSYTKIMFSAKKLWDENNQNDVINSGNYYVLRTDETVSNLACGATADTPNYRDGHYQTINRRKCNVESTVLASVVSTLGMDTGETPLNMNDIDDFHNQLTYIINGTSWISGISIDNAIMPTTGNINLYLSSSADLDVFADNTLTIKIMVGTNEITLSNVASSSTSRSIHFRVPTNTIIENKKARLIENSLLGNITNSSGNTLGLTFNIKNEIQTSVEYIDYSISGTTISTETNNLLNSTNIKRLRVELTNLQISDEDEEDTISFFYYATNIGTDVPLVKVNN